MRALGIAPLQKIGHHLSERDIFFRVFPHMLDDPFPFSQLLLFALGADSTISRHKDRLFDRWQVWECRLARFSTLVANNVNPGSDIPLVKPAKFGREELESRAVHPPLSRHR